MGLAALLIYVALLWAPFGGLRRIEERERSKRHKPPIYFLAIGLQASLVGYIVVSFFASVAYLWYVYYLVAYCICLRRITSTEQSLAVARSTETGNSPFLNSPTLTPNTHNR